MHKPWRTGIACTSIAALLVAGCTSGAKKNNPDTTPAVLAATGGSAPADGDNSKLDPKSLVPQMFAAVKAAGSFHVVGTGTDSSGTSFELDVHFGGGGGSGHFSDGSERFDLAGKGSSIWVKTSAAAWKATIGNKPSVDTMASTLAGRWVEVPTTNTDFAQLAQYVDKDTFVASFSRSASSVSGPFAKTGTASVDGTAAIVFTDTNDQSKIYIAAHGAPLLLKVEGSGSQGGGANLALTDYNKPFTPALPPPDQVIAYTSVVN